MAGGGAVCFGSFNDGNARNVKRLVDELGAHPDDVITSPAGMGRALRKAFDWYQETGDRSETINRAAIYQQRAQSGRSHLRPVTPRATSWTSPPAAPSQRSACCRRSCRSMLVSRACGPRGAAADPASLPR